MELSRGDHALVSRELGREPNGVEEALFVNLWSEHCAYRSSRPMLADLPTESSEVLIGPGDDAAVLEFSDDIVLAVGMESHNHPSYVDPYDGAATGVGGIVRDVISMGARPIALMDTIYFGEFDREKTRYLFEGVVEGIADYGNSIGVPTVGGQTYFDESYNGNPLVNVVCVGAAPRDRVVTAACENPGNRLVLVGSSTGRDGLGGASFASEDLGEEAESEDRPAVQVGDPYTEKLLIDASLEIVEYADAARDLGAAGLAGASCEMASKGGLGAYLWLDKVHLREEGMTALEILLSESQERMLFEVPPSKVERVQGIAERYDLESSVVGEVTDSDFVAEYRDEVVVDLPADFLADGAPVHDLESREPVVEDVVSGYGVSEEGVLEALRDPNNASKEWVYRQYDHEVQTRTVVKPGDDSSVLDMDGKGLALSSGCNSRRVAANPYEGGRETVLENAVNLAVKGARPIALVNCLNFGNPERPEIYGEFEAAVRGLGDMARELSIPVVGGNVSLYNESEEFGSAVNPTPSVGMLGVADSPDPPRANLTRKGDSLLLVNGRENPGIAIDRFAEAALHPSTSASHDVSGGGVAVALAEMCGTYGVSVEANDIFNEAPGRCVFATNKPDVLRDSLEPLEVSQIGDVTDRDLAIQTQEADIMVTQSEIEEARNSIEKSM